MSMPLPPSTSSEHTGTGPSTTSLFLSTLLPPSTSFTFTSLLSESPPGQSLMPQSSPSLTVSPTISSNASTTTASLPFTLSSLSISSSSPTLGPTSSITVTATSLRSSSFSSSFISTTITLSTSLPSAPIPSTFSSLTLSLSSSSTSSSGSATPSISPSGSATPSILETTDVSTKTSHTTPQSAWTSTFLTTEFFTYTKPGSTTITVRTVSSLVSTGSGVLSTGILDPNSNPFMHHPAAIVGVTLGVIIAFAFSAIWLFLAHRKHNKMKQDFRQGSGVALDPSLEGSWRLPFEDGEDENAVYQAGMIEQYPGILAALGVAHTQTHSGEIGDDVDGRIAHHPGMESSGSRRSSSLGPRPYMTGFGQAAEAITMQIPVDEDGLVSLARQRSSSLASVFTRSRPPSCVPEPGHSPGSAETAQRANSPTHLSWSGHSIGREDSHRGSAASLNLYSSSHGHGAASSSSATSVNGRRSSGSKRLSLTQLPGPPTSFSFKGKEIAESDNRSLKGFIGFLRSGRRSNSNIEESESPPRRTQSMSFSPYTSSPSSLLGPQPVRIGSVSSMRHKPSLSESQSGGRLWPGSGPLTLPPAPSPAVTTECLPTSEGLLDPRLESLASLADHEDYSRPIGGVVNNTMHSTTTFDTQDTVTTNEP